ncbi:MAG: hypothetical protein GWM90_28045 [Gemmatimonadetes bacterium]|nr:zinc ribbon domain-containing protein [Gemmatimonadota bacterium]NIQ58689.1 zinc ribbon domain-containing protein [Gemmatimonadota bacterium]NIU79052.1 hypothetical protein [Gammaproteobacteria bacterium]NIX47781.1 hypothetical protein [Gemmatimonadota bacterium]
MEILVVGVLAVVAIAAVAYPLVSGRDGLDEAALDTEVDRYRTALREGTLCPECLAANPPGSRYCAECGTGLEPGDAERDDGGAS